MELTQWLLMLLSKLHLKPHLTLKLPVWFVSSDSATLSVWHSGGICHHSPLLTICDKEVFFFFHLNLIPWTLGEQQYKTLVDNWSPVYPNVVRVQGWRMHLDLWDDRRIPTAGHVGGWGELNREQVAEASCFIWPGGSLHPCIFGTDCLRIGYCRIPKGYWWTFGVASGDVEKIKQLSTLSSLLENTSVVGLMHVEEQQVPIATMAVHWSQYCT